MRLRAIRNVNAVVTRVDTPNGGAARPVIVNGRSLPTTVRWWLNASNPALPC